MSKTFNLKDKLIVEKNVDRTRFYKENLSIQACYHLENGNKTGIIYINQITPDLKFNLIKKQNYDYGILDIKFDDSGIYTSNSDSSFTLLTDSLDLIHNHKLSIAENNSCNTLDKRDNLLLLAMNDGSHYLYDINSSVVSANKAHEYGLWSIYWYSDTNYLTGSEDSILKLWDIREKEYIV
jgi:hypothetical protein